METTNSRFYKSPSPDVYKKQKAERETLLNNNGEIKFNNTEAKMKRCELETAEISRRDAKWAQMQTDRFKSHYGGMFNVDKSDDIKIDDILRQTLSRPFEKDYIKHIRVKDNMMASSDNASPFAKTTVTKEQMDATFNLKQKCAEPQVNFHQTHLDVYPFRNGLKKV